MILARAKGGRFQFGPAEDEMRGVHQEDLVLVARGLAFYGVHDNEGAPSRTAWGFKLANRGAPSASR